MTTYKIGSFSNLLEEQISVVSWPTITSFRKTKKHRKSKFDLECSITECVLNTSPAPYRDVRNKVKVEGKMKDEGSQLQHLYHKLSHLDAHLGVCN